MSKRPPIPLLIAALGLLLLPPVLLALGLTMTSATEVVTYALACMAHGSVLRPTPPRCSSAIGCTIRFSDPPLPAF